MKSTRKTPPNNVIPFPSRRLRPRSPDWDELRNEYEGFLAEVEGLEVSLPLGCFDLDSEGVITAHESAGGEALVGRNFFDLMPFVFDFDYEEFVRSGFTKTFKYGGYEVSFLRVMPPGNAVALVNREAAKKGGAA